MNMKRDDTISAALRAGQHFRDMQRAARPLAQTGSILDILKSDPVRQALAANTALKQHPGTAAMLAAASGSGALSEQMKSILALPKLSTFPPSAIAGIKAAGDLGMGGHLGSVLAASRMATTPAFATGGAVVDALKSIKAHALGNGVLAGLLRGQEQGSATRQIQSALGVTGAILALNGAIPTTNHDALARATQWSVERSVVGGALAEMMRKTGIGVRERAALMDGATRTASASWRTMMDGTMGASLAGLRPSVVSAYAGLHRTTLPIVARASDFALPRADGAIAGHLADHLARLHREISEMIAPLNSALAASRASDAEAPASVPDRELVAVAVELEQAMTEVAATGTLDALLHFLDRAFAAFARNTAREFENMGAITLLPLLVALAQAIFWLQPAWTPAPDAAPPPGIERVQQEQQALSERFDALTATLARQEVENLDSIPRVRVKRSARVRTGPGTEFPGVWRLPPDEVVGARDRENGWVLIFYRDPLSGTLGSGWVYAALLDQADEGR